VVATGLMAGEHVVTTGFARIAEGSLVQVTNAEDAGQIPTGGRPDRPRGGSGAKGSGTKGSGEKGAGEKGKATQTSGGKASTPP
jgi:multidrug efflux system membrane fusion protein